MPRVENGALVTDVDSRSPVAEAGMEPRSVITAAGGDRAHRRPALRPARDASGDSVEMTVASGGEAREVIVEFGERG